MTERSEMDNVRLSNAYTRYAKDPTVDVNDPDNIIIALEKECEQRGNRIKELYKELIRTQVELNGALKTVKPSILEAAQDNTMNDVIKALADNGYNTITINCYKDIESEE